MRNGDCRRDFLHVCKIGNRALSSAICSASAVAGARVSAALQKEITPVGTGVISQMAGRLGERGLPSDGAR